MAGCRALLERGAKRLDLSLPLRAQMDTAGHTIQTDMLAGLTTWAFFDNDREDAVSAIFGSGCSAVVSQAVRENRRGGKRTFLGLFDPSVRPYVGANELSFVIPASRFPSMAETMRQCCLFDTHAWAKVKARING